MDRGSFVTARGTIHGAPVYGNLPSGTPVLYFYVQVRNPSNWPAALRAVDYGNSAQALARNLSDGMDIFLEGWFQTRLHHERLITEVVTNQVVPHQTTGSLWIGRYGARATLVGKIVEAPVAESFDKVSGVRFTVETPNPEGKGYPARIAVVPNGVPGMANLPSRVRPGGCWSLICARRSSTANLNSTINRWSI